eukprot:EST44468.1 Protein SEY1 [Spironucleus salmonicida]
MTFTAISIFGPQSSGKSTLLNDLFDTKLQTLELSTPRSQTTKGVIAVQSSKYLIFDVEGTDSRERRFQQQHVSEKFAAFACAVGDVFIINIWDHDIGRYEASGYGILAKVFSIFTRKIKNQRENTNKISMIFCVRDSKIENNESLRLIEKQIQEDILTIWKEQSTLEFSAQFNVNFFFLAHREYQKQQYDIGVQTLKKYLGEQGSFNAQIPQELRAIYFKNLWNLVDSDEELDLGREMMLMRQIQFSREVQASLKEFQDRTQQSDCKIRLIEHELCLSSSIGAFQVNSKIGQLLKAVCKVDFQGLYDSKQQMINNYLEKKSGVSQEIINDLEIDFENEIQNIFNQQQKDFVQSIYLGVFDSFVQIDNMFQEHINYQVEEGELCLNCVFLDGLSDLFQLFKLVQDFVKPKISSLTDLKIDLSIPFADQLEFSVGNLSSLFMLNIISLEIVQKFSISQLYTFFFEMMYLLPILIHISENFIEQQFELQNQLELMKNKFVKLLISQYFKLQKDRFYVSIKKDVAKLIELLPEDFYDQLVDERQSIVIQTSLSIEKSFSESHIMFSLPNQIGISSAYDINNKAISNFIIGKSEGLIKMVGQRVYLIKQLGKYYNQSIQEIIAFVIQNNSNRIMELNKDNINSKQSILNLQSGFLPHQVVEEQQLQELQISLNQELIDTMLLQKQTKEVVIQPELKARKLPIYTYFIILLLARNDIKAILKHKLLLLSLIVSFAFLFAQQKRGKDLNKLKLMVSQVKSIVKSYQENDPDKLALAQSVLKEEFLDFIK